jgi:hypothetical protein
MTWLRKFCLVASPAAALLVMPLFAQPSPMLQISQSGGNALLSWTTASGYQLVQTTTNLSRPITWQSGSANLFFGGPVTDVPVTISQPSQFFRLAQVVPVFQFGVFYNLDLDISPGQPMTLNGPVFCNGNIWMWPYAAMTFNNSVEAAGTVYAQMQPNDQQSSSGYVAPTYIAGQPVSHVGPLVLLSALTNAAPASLVQTFLNLPPPNLGAPNPAAYLSTNQIYLFNESDLIISNSIAGTNGTKGTNITVWFQDPNQPTALTRISNDFYALKTGGSTNIVNNFSGVDSPTNVIYASFSFVTNVQFYDYRESDTIQAVQVDVGKLNIWLTNTAGTGGNQWNWTNFADKGHGIDSIYIYNSVPLTLVQLPAVRLVNGAQLPCTVDPGGSGLATGGLTVATPMPLYVKGNYNVQTATSSASASAGTTNTAYTYPAALMGDAITVLSANWSDNYTSSTSLTSRAPTSTTLNAACLEGIVQSTNVGSSLYYSGGIENFLRLEENWSSSYTLTYNGSIVVMFPSIYATNFWQVPGSYYNPPIRHWNFDLNFTDLTKLPPLTPMVSNFVTP